MLHWWEGEGRALSGGKVRGEKGRDQLRGKLLRNFSQGQNPGKIFLSSS